MGSVCSECAWLSLLPLDSMAPFPPSLFPSTLAFTLPSSLGTSLQSTSSLLNYLRSNCSLCGVDFDLDRHYEADLLGLFGHFLKHPHPQMLDLFLRCLVERFLKARWSEDRKEVLPALDGLAEVECVEAATRVPLLSWRFFLHVNLILPI